MILFFESFAYDFVKLKGDMNLDRYIASKSTIIKIIDKNRIVLKTSKGRYALKGNSISIAVEGLLKEFIEFNNIVNVIEKLSNKYSENSLKNLVDYLIDIHAIVTESYYKNIESVDNNFNYNIRYYLAKEDKIKEVHDLLNGKIGLVGNREFLEEIIKEFISVNIIGKINATILNGPNEKQDVNNCSISNFDNVSINESINYTLENSDITLVFSDYNNHYLFDEVNRTALENGKKWIRIMVDRDYVEIGPLFIPNSTGCYNCLNYRASINMDEEDFIFDSLYEGTPNSIENGLVYDFILVKFIASILIRELLQFVTVDKNNLINNVLTIDWNNYKVRKEKIFKNPNCELCSGILKYNGEQ